MMKRKRSLHNDPVPWPQDDRKLHPQKHPRASKYHESPGKNEWWPLASGYKIVFDDNGSPIARSQKQPFREWSNWKQKEENGNEIKRPASGPKENSCSEIVTPRPEKASAGRKFDRNPVPSQPRLTSFPADPTQVRSNRGPQGNDYHWHKSTSDPRLPIFSSNTSQFQVQNDYDRDSSSTESSTPSPSDCQVKDNADSSDVSSSDSDSDPEDQNTLHSECGVAQRSSPMTNSSRSSGNEIHRPPTHDKDSSLTLSRNELKAKAEKAIRKMGKRIKEKGAHRSSSSGSGSRQSGSISGLESCLLSNLKNIIPKHILEAARHRLADTQHKKHKFKSQNSDRTKPQTTTGSDDQASDDRATVLEAARDLILRISAQWLSTNRDHVADISTNTNQREPMMTTRKKPVVSISNPGSVFPDPATNSMQNELARIVRDKDNEIRLLELELRNHRHMK